MKQTQDVATQILEKFEDVEPESFLKVFSPNQRVVIDLLYLSPASLSVKQIRDQFVNHTINEVSSLVFQHYSMMLTAKEKERMKPIPVPASIRFVNRALESGFVSPPSLEKFVKEERKLLEKLVFNEPAKDTRVLRELEKLLTKHKIAKTLGFSTVQNTLESLKQQGVVVSIASENLRTNELFTLSPVLDSFLKKKKYTPMA